MLYNNPRPGQFRTEYIFLSSLAKVFFLSPLSRGLLLFRLSGLLPMGDHSGPDTGLIGPPGPLSLAPSQEGVKDLEEE